MQTRNLLGLALSAAALLGAAATGQATGPQAFTLDFDGPGSVAEDYTPSFLTVGYGQYLPMLDIDGDPIPGSDYWSIEPGAGSVPVLDPAPSASAPRLHRAMPSMCAAARCCSCSARRSP